jgi:hypothetical protein
MLREIPMFSIKYTLSINGVPAVDDGDYDELSAYTEEHLNGYISKFFDGSPAIHVETEVQLHKTGDPLVVDYHVGSHFRIPGEVPTLRFMFERIREAFEGEEAANYISLLSQMNPDQNALHATTSIELVNHEPDLASDNGQSGGSRPSPVSNKKSVMIPFLAGIGFLVLVIIGLMWVRKRRSSRAIEFDSADQLRLDEEDHSLTSAANEAEKGANGSSSFSTRPYGVDEETLRYLHTIREKYKEEDDSKSSKASTELEEVSLDDDCTEDAGTCLSLDDDYTEDAGTLEWSIDGCTVEATNTLTSAENSEETQALETLYASTRGQAPGRPPSQELEQIEESLSEHEDELSTDSVKSPGSEMDPISESQNSSNAGDSTRQIAEPEVEEEEETTNIATGTRIETEVPGAAAQESETNEDFDYLEDLNSSFDDEDLRSVA